MGLLTGILANLLSLITIAICFFLKIPQIINVYENKSAEGLNIAAIILELICYSTTTLYNFTNNYSILTYLEYPIILIQQMILIYLVLKYSNMLHTEATRFSFVSYLIIMLSFSVSALPSSLLRYVLPFCTPVSCFSKCLYIYTMMRAKSSETTSSMTWVISVATNAFRIFTVYVDSGDRYLLFNFTVSTLLSSAVLLTALYYKRPIETPFHRD